MSSGAVAFAGLSVITWVLVLGYLVLFGRLVCSGPAGMWMQLGIIWAAALIVSLVLPLGSLSGVAAVLVIASTPAIIVGFLHRSADREHDRFPWKSQRALFGFAFLVAVAIGLSLQTPGPVSGFDSGLYHLAAITQSVDFGVLPGVGNLYAPYAYHNGLFPFTGFLSAVTASDQAFRLVNGLLFLMALIDLYERWVRRAATPGAYVLATGLLVVAVLTLPLGDFWFFSPTPDTAVFILYVVVTAYLIDAFAAEKESTDSRSLGYVVVLSAVLASIRPVYLLPAAVAVIVVFIYRRGASLRMVRSGQLIGSFVVAAAVVIGGLARDVMMSGWLWYPLGLVSLPVEWRAPDPAPVRDVALAFNRAGYTGSEYMWSAHGWDWIPLWFSNYLTMNKGTLAIFLGLVTLAALTVVMCRLKCSSRQCWLPMFLALLPSGLTVVVWFFATPPAFRFVWGPLFMIPIIVLAWSASGVGDRSRLSSMDVVAVISAVAVAVVVIGSSRMALGRLNNGDLGPVRVLGVTASAQNLPSVDYMTVQLDSGVEILTPTGPMFLCWNEPVCSREPAEGLNGRTSLVRDGFVHSSK